MQIKKKPFTNYTLEEDKKQIKDKFTIRLNAEERELLNKCKWILEQRKDGTALKQLAWIGADVIHDKKIGRLLRDLFKNKRNNARLGISDFE